MTYLAPTELKERVLEILNFNEPPHARAQNVIYRYAIFTPQEEMKEIISKKPDERLETLRRALHIEGYKLTQENAAALASSCGKRASTLSAAAEDLEDKKRELQNVDRVSEEDRESLSHKAAEEASLKQELTDLNKCLDSLRHQKEELKKAEGERPQLERQKASKQQELQRVEGEFKNAVKKIHDAEEAVKEHLSVAKLSEKNTDELKRDVEILSRDHAGLVKNIHRIESKLEDFESVRAQGKCPTCDRPADPAEFEERIAAEGLALEKQRALVEQAESDIKDAKDMLQALHEYNDSLAELKTLQAQAGEWREIEATKRTTAEHVRNDIAKLDKELKAATGKIEDLDGISTQIEQKKEERDTTETMVIQVGKEIATLNEAIAQLERTKQMLTDEIQIKEEKLDKAGVLSQYKLWLDGYFIPTVNNIEKHVMIEFQQEFNKFFEKWFRLLIDDPTKDARIDESFTPIVEQGGYEQPLGYLSGGEKTSVALAYRLALNTIVRKAASMKSNLLILDEPTDGFSKEQLLKMQDIFEELACPQVIIVSHERELESFANQVFWISKSEGVSTIQEA